MNVRKFFKRMAGFGATSSATQAEAMDTLPSQAPAITDPRYTMANIMGIRTPYYVSPPTFKNELVTRQSAVFLSAVRQKPAISSKSRRPEGNTDLIADRRRLLGLDSFIFAAANTTGAEKVQPKGLFSLVRTSFIIERDIKTGAVIFRNKEVLPINNYAEHMIVPAMNAANTVVASGLPADGETLNHLADPALDPPELIPLSVVQMIFGREHEKEGKGCTQDEVHAAIVEFDRGPTLALQ